MFPEFPADLSALTDDELSALLDGFVSVVRGVRDGDAETVGELSPVQIVAEMEVALPQIETIRSAISERAATEAAPARLEELAASVLDSAEAEEAQTDENEEDEDEATEEAGDESTEEADAEADEAAAEGGDDEADAEEAEAEGEAVVADAGEVTVPDKYKGRTRRSKPSMQPMVAAADVRGISAGARFESREQMIDAMIAKHDAISGCQRGVEGVFEDVPIAHFQRDFPEHMRPLTASSSPEQNGAALLANIGGAPGSPEQTRKLGGKALTAAGSLCAPLQTVYDIPVFGTAATPVQDSLPTVPATRGGITFFPPMGWNTDTPTANKIDDAITHITKAQDDAGGTSAQKTYQSILCPSPSSEYVGAHVKRVRIENLKARVWPELIDAFLSNLDIAYAASTETLALDFIQSKATKVALAAIGNLSTLSVLQEGLVKLTAGISSRNRIDPNARFRCLAPAWLPDLLVADTAMAQMDRFRTEAEIMSVLGKADIDVSYYLDSATTGGQLFGAQGAAEITDFPSTMRLYLYPEGSFVRMDTGQLDLGIVRDSTLNSVNEYEMFSEEFFGFAYVGGPEAYEVAVSVCPTGMTAGTMTVACGSI